METRKDTEFIPLMIPALEEADIQVVVNVLRSGMLVQGQEVAKLEQAVAKLAGTSHAVAVSNGTATLHLSLLALGIGPGDEVIVPAFSYVATANVVELVGATPVFVDIDLATFNIDVSKVEAAITPKTRAIIPVHEFGLSCDISRLMTIANQHKLFVIEDAACALGATEQGKAVGGFGTMGSFSLHPRKNVTSGEGGVIVLNDAALAERLGILRNHGIQMKQGKMEFVAAGYNYRLTEFQAALVNSQIERFDGIIAYKQQLAEIYLNTLNPELVQLPVVPADKVHTWQTFHVVVPETVDRDQFIVTLRENGIGTNYGAQCIPYMEYYKTKYQLDCQALFPNAMRAYQKGLALPLYERLNKDQVKMIAEKINHLISH